LGPDLRLQIRQAAELVEARGELARVRVRAHALAFLGTLESARIEVAEECPPMALEQELADGRGEGGRGRTPRAGERERAFARREVRAALAKAFGQQDLLVPSDDRVPVDDLGEVQAET